MSKELLAAYKTELRHRLEVLVNNLIRETFSQYYFENDSILALPFYPMINPKDLQVILNNTGVDLGLQFDAASNKSIYKIDLYLQFRNQPLFEHPLPKETDCDWKFFERLILKKFSEVSGISINIAAGDIPDTYNFTFWFEINFDINDSMLKDTSNGISFEDFVRIAPGSTILFKTSFPASIRNFNTSFLTSMQGMQAVVASTYPAALAVSLKNDTVNSGTSAVRWFPYELIDKVIKY